MSIASPVPNPAQRAIRQLDNARALSDAMCEVVVAHHEGDAFDFARTMVLVPGGRLVPAIERGLISRARAAGVPLIAPSIVTPLMLAGRLVVPSASVLSPLAARLAWREVLEASSVANDGFEARVAAVFGAPEVVDARVRTRIAQRMQRLGSEIASAMLSFQSVARHEAVVSRPELAERLAVLAEFATRRDLLLASVGAVDRDAALRDAARPDAPAHRLLTEAFERVVVLLADPEPVQRELLARLAERGVRVEVCVHAGASDLTRVDDDGFPVKAAWEKCGFPVERLPSAMVRVADGPEDCAREAVEAVRALSVELGRPVTSDEVALMAPDAETRRALERALALVGAPASAVESRRFSATRLGSLLERLAQLVGERSAESLAAFVRHDDIACWLERAARGSGASRASGAACAVTEYRTETLFANWQDDVVAAAEASSAFAPVRECVQKLAEPLLLKQPACAWARPIRAALAEIVGADPRGAFAGERARSVRALDMALVELAEVPAVFATPIGCDEAIGLILDELGSKELRGDRHVDGLSILGWLDTGMTDESLLVLAGFADGLVPQGAPVDPIVPDDLRRQFGMPS
ncbi:MAG: ATP-dependent helicase/nuclease subunit, partial [Planctomycetota bacterium]